MKKTIKRISLALVLLSTFSACNNYMDIIPDNVATIDYAFRLRSTAERFLFTCYSYMPSHADLNDNAAFLAGDELWLPPTNGSPAWLIARGNQRIVNPYVNAWQGGGGTKDLYEGIRQCNVFLENIDRVPDLPTWEKERWVAEVLFMKAYYHYWLVRMYGPVVLIKENLPVAAGRDEVQIPRSSVDECFAYIVELLDQALVSLPERIDFEIEELGRITRGIALAVKAQVLVTSASPLFNGNTDYSGFNNADGTPLFNPVQDPEKWNKAVQACREAIEFCESQGHELYYYQSQFIPFDLSDSTILKLNIRNSVTEKWNSEIIWANTNSMSSAMQARATPRGLDPARASNGGTSGLIAPPIKIAEMYYSSNGVPIEEDKAYDYAGRFGLQMATAAEKYNLKEGYTTAKLHFNREPRFYASLGFDGGIWYGQGRFDDDATNLFFVSSKQGQPAAAVNLASYSVTGYWPKKLVNINNVIGEGNTYTRENYPWPVIRLADLYLLYAEALNEFQGPGPEVYEYINRVRARAGLGTVEESWTQHSTDPNKFTTKEGLREIIHRERLIELSFEGHRFWDLRRWKEALLELNNPITGWDLEQPTAEGYYREKLIFNQTFSTRDYFWPLNENVLLSNTKLSQNPGW
ncbi:MAG TPA: RagB/SusD family nutrient uptake outer membrane protein [Anseongella sp.]|nr:RagB/SusD family nutrient uptake outer membrane protein [Anseongella sp.]